MNSRQAKRVVCAWVVTQLHGDWLDLLIGELHHDDDCCRLEAARDDLIDELLRRSGNECVLDAQRMAAASEEREVGRE
jgi:hypothetical protein